jgi:hypothetical protein
MIASGDHRHDEMAILDIVMFKCHLQIRQAFTGSPSSTNTLLEELNV